MAGLPELNGVFGTFGGMSGLDLTPLQMKQRQQMFQKQLAQEAAQLAQQGKLATRGLDLQERGQDLGTQENELARKFAENLNKMRNEFDAGESTKQRDAVAAQQQRAIQESQRSQGSAQDFQGGQAELQRGFAGEQAQLGREFQREESAMDRALKAEALSFDKERFEKTFGLQSEQFNFTKDITLKDQARQDRSDDLKQQMFELQKQEFGSQAEQRTAQTKLVSLQAELYGQQLMDAREEANLTDDDLNNIIETAGSGDISSLDASVLKKLTTNKKTREAVFGIMELVKSSQEIGLVKKATEKQATTEEAAKARTADDITKEQQEPGEIGLLRKKVSADIEAEEDPERKKSLADLMTLTEGMEADDFNISNSPDAADAVLGLLAIPTMGASLGLLMLKKTIESGGSLTRSERETAIMEIAEKLGYDLDELE